tara:strand:+ start:3534 stop:3803 length:270 start_codon:yes stop_codon:yes gene_type:complete
MFLTETQKAIIQETDKEIFRTAIVKDLNFVKAKIGNIENTIDNMLKTTKDITNCIEQMEKQRRKIDEELNTKLHKIKENSWYNYFGFKV